jgi:serine protease
VYTTRRGLLGILVSVSIFATYSIASSPEVNPVLHHPTGAAAESVHQQILVKLRGAAASAAHRQALAIERKSIQAAGLAATPNGTLEELAGRSSLIFESSREITTGVHVLQVRSGAGEPIAATLARLRADPNVETADIDERRYPHAVPNDPLYQGQWYEQATQPAGTDAVTAWDTSTGRSDIVIAELDTGVRFDHPDLLNASASGRLLNGYDFVTNAAVANDGDGRDADASDPGDWVTTADTQTQQFSGCTTGNSSWHGTRVAGILGALSNNATGITGMSWNPKILPLRVLGKCGGVDSDILDAMRWAAGLHVAGVPDNTHPAKVINLSLGGQGTCTSAEQTVINEVVATGATIIVSAGNDGSTVDAPANCAGVAGVGGLRNSGTKVGFSNLGPTVALSAPGGNCVNSTGPCTYSLDTTTNSGTTAPTTNTYTDQLNPNLGTSFSAPIVAGIAAIMTSVNPNLRPSELITRLKLGTKPFPAAAPGSSTPTCHVPASSSDVQTAECVCTTQTCGAGMANAPAAVTEALRPVVAIAIPATIAAGQNVSFSAAASGAACSRTVTTYAWTVTSPANYAIQGANTSKATIVAPSSGTVTLKLTVTDDAGHSDSDVVIVNPTSAASTAPSVADTGTCIVPGVSINPTSSSVQAGGATQAFSAQVNSANDAGVNWYVNNVPGGDSVNGTITTSGVYTPPGSVPSPNVVTVSAVWTSDTTKYATAQVTINAPVSISISPVLANVTVGSTQTFTAAVANAPNTAVTWSVNGIAGGNATLGTISPAGVYTAPAAVPSPSAVTISAASTADPNKLASASTTVSAAAASSGSTGSGSSGGSSTSGSGSASSSSSGGGGPMEPLTLLVCACAVGLVAKRRRAACEDRHV